MAQVTEFSEYEAERLNFKQGTLDMLQDLVEALTPLKTEFGMVLGDICCGTCASYEGGTQCKLSGNPYYLYWSIQDEEGLDRNGDYMWIGFGGVNGTDEEALAAGKKIAEVLQGRDYKIEWPESPHSRIRVDIGA